MQVNIDSIQVNSGRREALPDAVRELADSISAVGLLNPITVDRDYILIAGLHRLEAAKLLGWAEIECNVSSLEGLQAELAEIDENFVRADLETVEFGKLLLRRKEIYEMLHPETKYGVSQAKAMNRAKGSNVSERGASTLKSFSRDTADKLGISPRSVEEKIQIARDMTPKAQEIIQDADRKIKKKDLLKLSRMEPEQQEQAAAQLATGRIKSADEFRQEEPPRPSKPPEPAQEPKRAAEPEQATEPVTEPPAVPAVPYTLGDKHYDTLEESIADLKNPDKDCSYTPDTLLADIDGFVQTFHKGFAWYHDPFCTIVFPHISKVQFEFVREHFFRNGGLIKSNGKDYKSMSNRKKRRPPGSERTEQQNLLTETQYANPGVPRDLSSNQLTSGLPYQRPVEPEDVDRLIAKWDDRLLTPLVVSFRDGKFNVVDGQHRIAAMRKMADGGNITVPCLIYTGLSYEQEAELYFKLDQSKGRLRLSHATKALLESGTDAEVLEIKRLVEAAGFVWVLDKKSGDAYEILSTRAIINAYRLLGGAAFSRLLVLLDGTWHGASISLRASMLSGMALFLKIYETELDDRTFIKRLSVVDPEEIIRRGKMDFSTNKAALRFARVILEKYNSQQRGGHKLPYRFKG